MQTSAEKLHDDQVSEKQPLLRVDKISKSWPGVRALSEVSFDLYPGEVHCLIGENGAGKSTLVKILAGALQPDSGQIELGGQIIRFRGPSEAKAAGIACIFQELSVVGGLTVAENIVLGAEPGKLGQFDVGAAEQVAGEILAGIGFDDLDVHARVAGLSSAQKQAVMIAKALNSSARVIIMDEPTSPLEEQEVRKLFDVIAKLKAQGHGIIYVSHRMREIDEIADRITVLKDGGWVATRKNGEASNRELVSLMVGRDFSDVFPPKAQHVGKPVLEVSGLTGAALHDISFVVHSGEVLGVAGLVGAGRTELLRTIFGAEEVRAGRIAIDGVELQPNSVHAAIRAGVALVPEERRAQGIVGALSVFDNLVLPWNEFPARRRENSSAKTVATEMVAKLDVRTPSINQRVSLLSGGNQQKVVLGKWLLMQTSVLLLDEPTRGIDIGAKREIYNTVQELAGAGLAILLVSSELPEVIGLSNRILVLNQGHVVGELSGDSSESDVMELSMLSAR